MNDDLVFLPAAEQARRIAAGTVRARDLTEAYLARIAAIDGQLGAYLTVDAEGARAQADAVDRARAQGDTLGPLAGVPLGIKDILVTRDLETTAGSRMLAGWRPPYDATVVTRLRRAGAVILGKLNMDEFAMGSSNENAAFRPCRNPWDLTRVPGGSSGGSAVATAAGLCGAALGTDTGGSIRQPAALCGIVGLKPTYGRVSRYGLIAFASSLDQAGPMTRTVEDAALLLEVMAGLDPNDATSSDAPVPRYRDALERGVRGLTIGLPEEYFSSALDGEIAAAVQAAISALEQQGARMRKISLPHTRYALATYYLIAPAEASSNLARFDGVRYGARSGDGSTGLFDMYTRTRGQHFGPEVKRRIMLGTFALRSGYYDAFYRKAQQVRSLIRGDFERAFAEVDLVLSPTSPTAAFRAGERVQRAIDMYLSDVFTLSCNLAGLPGISVPCGFTAAGLPIGMQLLGRVLDESTILAAAAAHERATDFTARRPPEVPS
jgi:aspartyl-tRNA(Asn)/glutamyl-tRNA(Gln) amidotransferase subunit A